MCGFIGILSQEPTVDYRARTAKALTAIRHRGPDGEGIFQALEGRVLLGHRRLSIIDPEHGHQPMSTQDGQLTIVFNGAIYNYLELRRELIAKGHRIVSYSDTEVLLHAYQEWGEHCVKRFLGMFAFVIWDSTQKRLFCARDRVGIKPFYYSSNDSHFVCASEIKAIFSGNFGNPAVNPAGLKDYLTFQFCLGDKTLFKGIRKLEPGHFLTVDFASSRIRLNVSRYWDLSYDIDDVHEEGWFVQHLAGLVEDAVRIHLRSDVPLGAHLSGGLDSTAVVCIAANLLKGERLDTFTGAFREGTKFDETAYAKLVSKSAATVYHEVYVDGRELSNVLPRLIYIMDEPAAGPGIIPQYYVSMLAGQHVKVVLGGQGGDELFLGYVRYLAAYLEQCLKGAIFETKNRSRYAVSLESIVPNLPALQAYCPMLQNFWANGIFEDPERRYFKLIDRSEGMTHLFSPELFELQYDPFESYEQIFNRPGLHSLINRMTYFDLKGSLPALLHVEDRTSMAASVESRVPLIDHRIVEFMAKIAPNVKFAGGRMKHLFKGAIKNFVPAEIFDRKDKMGFPVPFGQWTTGVARDFVRDTLLSSTARQRGLYNIPRVEKALENQQEFGRIVWGLLCTELWHRIFIDGDKMSVEESKPPSL